jgi:phosphate/sulfate permease
MPIITIATILQFRLGVTFTPPEVVGPIAGFSILAVAAVWVIVAVLRRIPESTSDTA